MYFTEKNYLIYGQALETAYTLWSVTKNAEYQTVAFDIIEKSRSAILADARKNMEIKPQTIPADLLIKEKMLNRALTGFRISVVNEKGSLKNLSLKNKIIDNELELSRLRQSYEKISPQYFKLKYQSCAVIRTKRPICRIRRRIGSKSQFIFIIHI